MGNSLSEFSLVLCFYMDFLSVFVFLPHVLYFVYVYLSVHTTWSLFFIYISHFTCVFVFVSFLFHFLQMFLLWYFLFVFRCVCDLIFHNSSCSFFILFDCLSVITFANIIGKMSIFVFVVAMAFSLLRCQV